MFSLDSGKVFGVLSQGLGDGLRTLVKAEPIYPIATPQAIAEVKKPAEDFAKVITGGS